MKQIGCFLLICLLGISASCKQNATDQKEETSEKPTVNSNIKGDWVRVGFNGPIRLHFEANDVAKIDFGNDQTDEVSSSYRIHNDTIIFTDRDGKTCPHPGKYLISRNEYYMAFNLIRDDCGGRIKKIMAFWVRPNYKDQLEQLNDKIAGSGAPADHLNRARMFMALSKPKEAKSDFDYYIEHAEPNARVYVNRASTKFPGDMKGVISDCDKAINLDSSYKNAYFLKGLALYQLGKKEEACLVFNKAIELGFSILREAERQRCEEYWKKQITQKTEM